MSGGISATTLAAYAAAGAAVIGTYSAISAGQREDAQKQYQADQAQADADAEAGKAQVEAQQIRKAAEKQRAAARAAYADSGVNVDVGSAELVQTDIEKQGEQDALTTILNGSTKKRQLDAQAQGLRIAGSNAVSASYINAGSSVLSAGSKIASGWKTGK